MATVPVILTEASTHLDGSQVLSRYQSYGPSGQIPPDVVGELLINASRFQSPAMATVTGWLAVERACQLSAAKPNKAASTLKVASENMSRGLEPGRIQLFPDDSPDKVYRRQVASIDLPLYGSLALNNSMSQQEINENQARLALLARSAVKLTENFRKNELNPEAIQMDGFLAELIVRMGFNRTAMSTNEGIVGFAASSTFRQDNTPYSRGTLHGFGYKRNWDVSIFIRRAEHDSNISEVLGYLGRSAIRKSGLIIGNRWGVAAKLQVKTRSTTVLTDRPGRDTVADEYDSTQVTTFGVVEDIGLENTYSRLKVMKLLATEGLNGKLSTEESEQLELVSGKIKHTILAKLGLIPG